MSTPRVVALETDRLGSTCVQLRRCSGGGCMLQTSGRFALIAETVGVEVVQVLPGPYRCAMDHEPEAFPPAHRLGNRILISRRSSRGSHDIPVKGETTDDWNMPDLIKAIREASVVIGPNSGTVHLAALLGCRTITFDSWGHNSTLPEGAGHNFTWTKAGLLSVFNSL